MVKVALNRYTEVSSLPGRSTTEHLKRRFRAGFFGAMLSRYQDHDHRCPSSPARSVHGRANCCTMPTSGQHRLGDKCHWFPDSPPSSVRRDCPCRVRSRHCHCQTRRLQLLVLLTQPNAPPERFIAIGTMPRPMCSTISSASITRDDDTRHWAI
jgi:hypothetical protein